MFAKTGDGLLFFVEICYISAYACYFNLKMYYGHYHESYVEDKDGISFRCLGIQEIYQRT